MNLRTALAGPPVGAPRWKLVRIREQVPALRASSLPGVWQCLRRAGIHFKRGRDYIHSPDPEYRAKAERIAGALGEARAAPERVVLLYVDEKSYSNQPTVASDSHRAGKTQPVARRTPEETKWERIVGALDAVSGRVLVHQDTHIRTGVFSDFLRKLRQAYPEVERVYVVLDNWRQVHAHPRVQAEAVRQRITLVYLPTYSPWLNPIEKLWRWLCQEVLHLHRLAAERGQLDREVAGFLARLAQGGSPSAHALLRYVGLSPPETGKVSC